MKKIILLFSFCCFMSISQAQEFWIQRYSYFGKPNKDESVIIHDMKLKNETETLLRFVSSRNSPQRAIGFKKNRERWINLVKKDVLTKEIKKLLKDTSFLIEKAFTITSYFDKDGKIFTVSFIISHSIYEQLPENWLKNTFNRLMKEKIDVTGFWNFTQGKKDGLGSISFSLIDLIKGCIGEPDEKIDPDMKKQFHAPQKTNNAMVIWKIYKEYQLST